MTAMNNDRLAPGGLGARELRRLACLLEAESDRWFLWIPVCFGAGAGLYFAQLSEPSSTRALAYLLVAGICFGLARRSAAIGVTLLAGMAFFIALGFADAKWRASRLATPMLSHATGLVNLTGWIERVERRPGARHRLTISILSIDRVPRAGWPKRVRLTVTSRAAMPPSGTAVAMRARLSPLPEPVAPEAFDFARKAWFAGLGAVGYGLGPPKRLENPPALPAALWLTTRIDRWRRAIGTRIRTALPGPNGDLAAALITGDRGGIRNDTLDHLRHSGLAHLLAISGMHMAMIAGALFWLVRAVLAGIPRLALAYSIKKWAAAAALIGGAFYLALSGGSVATQRAFLMISIMFAAVMLDRPALTLRNVAIAAIVILAAFPESVVNVSFQMSFAAVVALVAVYEVWSPRWTGSFSQTPWGRVGARALRYVGAVALTTLIASIAVAPFAAFHFHKLAQFGLLANLLAMPIFGLVVMPMALLALLAMPFGFEAAPLSVMGFGIDGITAVAAWVSQLDGAVIYVPAMPSAALVLLALGGLWLCLWRGGVRWLGLAIAAFGLLVATTGDRPDVMIDRDGATVAVRAQGGRLRVAGAVKKTFSLERWLLADGDRTPAKLAVAAEAYRCDAIACLAQAKGRLIAIIHHPAAIEEECARSDIVISRVPLAGRCSRPGTVVDRRDLWARGAHALYLRDTDVVVLSAADIRGIRPWVLRARAKSLSAVRDRQTADAAQEGLTKLEREHR